MDLSDLQRKRFATFLKISEPRIESRYATSEPSIRVVPLRANIEEMVAPRKHRRSPRKRYRAARAAPLIIDRLRTDLQPPDYFVPRVRTRGNWCPEFLSKYLRENSRECDEEDSVRQSSSNAKTFAPEKPKIYSVGLQNGANALKASNSEELLGLSGVMKSLRRCYDIIHRGCLSLIDQRKSSVYDHFSHEEVEPEEWPKPSLIASSSSISPYPEGQNIRGEEFPGMKPDFSVIYCKHGRSMIKENSQSFLEPIASENSLDLLSNLEYRVPHKYRRVQHKRHKSSCDKMSSMHYDMLHPECEIMAEGKNHFGVSHKSYGREKCLRLTRDVEVQTTSRKRSHVKKSRKKDKLEKKSVEELDRKYEGFVSDKNDVRKEVNAIFTRNFSNLTNETFNSGQRTRFEIIGQKRITNYTSKFVETKEKLEKICGMLRDIDVNSDTNLGDKCDENTIKPSVKRHGRRLSKVDNHFGDAIENYSKRTGNSNSIVYTGTKKNHEFHEINNQTMPSSAANILNNNCIKQMPKIETQMDLGVTHTRSRVINYNQQLLDAKVSELAILQSVKRRIDKDFDALPFKELNDNEEHRSISIIATENSKETEFNRGIYFESSKYSDSFIGIEESKSLPLMTPWRMICSSKKKAIRSSASTTITIQQSRKEYSDSRYFSCTKLSSLGSIPPDSSYHTPLRIHQSEDFDNSEYALDCTLKYLSPIEKVDLSELNLISNNTYATVYASSIADNYNYETSRDSTNVSRNDSSDSAKILEENKDLRKSGICPKNSDIGDSVVITPRSSKCIVESIDSGVSTDLSPMELCTSGNSLKIEELENGEQDSYFRKLDAVCSLNFNSDISCSDDSLERKVDKVVEKFTENLIVCERRAKMKLNKLEKAKNQKGTTKWRKYTREILKSNLKLVDTEEAKKSFGWSSEDENDCSISSPSLPSVSDSEFEDSQLSQNDSSNFRLQHKTM